MQEKQGTEEEDINPTPSDLANINMRDWYTRRQAAVVLNCTEKYAQKLATQYGKFACYKLGDHLMLYWKRGVDHYAEVRPGQVGRPKKTVAAEEQEG